MPFGPSASPPDGSRPREGAQSQRLRAADPERGRAWASPLELGTKAVPGGSDSESLGWAHWVGSEFSGGF